MQVPETRMIMKYYGAIPGMLRELRRERSELEAEYCPLGGAPADGMPHSGGEKRPAESLAVRIAEEGTADRLREIAELVDILEGDRDRIRGCIDGLNGGYKSIILRRYLHGYSWAKISILTEVPEATIRRWHGNALLVLGEELDELPDTEGLKARASRART